MKTIAFFNNNGGVGKTSLLYHLAHMFADLGKRVVAADLDPQANLTGMCLTDDEIDDLWDGKKRVSTVHAAMRPLIDGQGDLKHVSTLAVADRLRLIPGDLALSQVEDEFSNQWPRCLSSEARAFRVTAAFDRTIRAAGKQGKADLGLIDVGPNLGAINRCALVAADYVVVPIGADLFSIRGLQNVGPSLIRWRGEWTDRRARAPKGLDFELPIGGMQPLGYVVSRYSSRGSRASKAFQRWLDKVPAVYAESVLNESNELRADHRLAQLKDYRSLMPMAQEARKPMFALKPADGAIGGHQAAVEDCRNDFKALAMTILGRLEGQLQ